MNKAAHNLINREKIHHNKSRQFTRIVVVVVIIA